MTNVRLTGHIALSVVNTLDLIDERTTPIDDWPDIDGIEGAACDAAIWVQTTDDDPHLSPTWGPWLRIDSAEVNCRAVGNVECRLSTADPTFNIQISELRLKAEEVA